MTALDSPHATSVALDEIEAYANGELDFETEDTEKLYANPQPGTVCTPNGSWIRITKIDGWLERNDEEILIVHAQVVSAPQCPQYEGKKVKVAVFADGTICVLTKHRT